jgi:hypothetical protein
MDVPPFFLDLFTASSLRKMRGFQNFVLKTDPEKLHGGSFSRQPVKGKISTMPLVHTNALCLDRADRL